MDKIVATEGGIDAFTLGYKTLGMSVNDQGVFTYREWAPGVKEAYLTGEFSEFFWPSLCCTRN